MGPTHLSSTVLFFASAAALVTAAEPDLRLVRAVEARNAPAVHTLLAEHVNVNIARADGATPLLLASHWDDVDLVDRLLRAGASVNAAESHGVTPLALACENASPSVVARLLKAGANPNLVEPSGLAPLMRAARSGHQGIVDALIAKGANVNAAIAITGQTALMWATAEQHADVMRALIAAGANVRAASTIGFTPLLFAVRNDDRDGIKMLLDAGAGVNQPGSDGTQALALAVVSGHDDLALYLLDHGADPNSAMFGITALHAAIGDIDKWLRDWLRLRAVSVRERNTIGVPLARRLPLVKALLARGANPNARISASTNGSAYLYPSNDRHGAFDDIEQHGTGDLNGATPLWVAADTAAPKWGYSNPDSVEMVSVLLKAGADPSLRTADHTTPLMMAAGLGYGSRDDSGRPRGIPSPTAAGAVRLLVEAGADVNAANEAGFTALHGAAYRGWDDVIKILVDHGANINAQDYKGRTPYRIAERVLQDFFPQSWPGTAAFIKSLGADSTLGPPFERTFDTPKPSARGVQPTQKQ